MSAFKALVHKAAVLLIAACLAFSSPVGDPKTAAFEEGFKEIKETDVRAYVNFLASPALRGRDTPSSGLDAALAFAASRLESLGYRGIGEDGDFLLPWTYPTVLETPDEGLCSFMTEGSGKVGAKTFKLARDFTPLPGAEGEVEGQMVFLGFGIHAPKDHYDDLRGGQLKGKLAIILSEEPRHKKLLDGADISPAANVYTKLKQLKDAGITGALVVRRPPLKNAAEPKKTAEGGEPPLDFGFHHTWATWNAPQNDANRRAALPAIEISVEIANELVGEDVLELAVKMDKRGKTQRRKIPGSVARFASYTETKSIQAANVAGLLEGSDPERKEEIVVLGAHFDHLGMDARGRMAAGADDNASGSAALLEVAEALAVAKPSRSVLILGFTGEEDGLLGSEAFCKDPPLPKQRFIAMLNLDMLGRGKDSVSIVLGVAKNTDLGKLLKRARKLAKTGVTKIITNKGDELWQRSDHYSFHKIGVPVLFFFEAVPASDNRDYHTWRDTPETLNFKKVTHTARLVYNMAWLLSEADKRPRESRK